MSKAAKILVVAGAVLLISSATPAFAAVSYSRSPSGSSITSPVSFSVSFDDFSDIAGALVCGSSCDFWRVGIESTPPESATPAGTCVSSTQTSGEFSYSLPVGYSASAVYAVVAATQEDCESADPLATATGDQGTIFEDAYPLAVFTIIEAASGVIAIPVGLAADLGADLGDQISDQGFLLFFGIAAGIPLAFFVFHELIGLVPSIRKHRKKYGEFG